jgi:hypothetical protein
MIEKELKEIWKELPEGTRLVAISKYHPADAIREAYDAGQRIFGENHVQELVEKEAVLPKDIEWHLTGHLQTNKVKYIARFVSLIHAVDSLKLLKEIDKQGKKVNRCIDCLLELHIAKEVTKWGFAEEKLMEMLEDGEWRALQNVSICGLMMMASLTDDTEQIRGEFQSAKRIFDKVKSLHFAHDERFCELSMGMSHDYRIAIEEGSTLVRVGTKIFGERVYK